MTFIETFLQADQKPCELLVNHCPDRPAQPRPVGLESSKVRRAKLCANQFEEITQTDNIGRDILGGRLHWWKYFPL